MKRDAAKIDVRWVSASPRPNLRFHHLAALDLHEVHARHILRTLLAGGPPLDEGDVAVDALHLHVPQRGADRLRLNLAGGGDACGDSVQPVPAAEAFRQAADVVALLLPQPDELD